MNDPQSEFLSQLKSLLAHERTERLYPCIEDLVRNGLDRARYAPGSSIPQRQDVTQHLAGWSKHAGLTSEECRSWLIEYCAEVLAPLSRRTPSAIRHSTKSNIKWIYESEGDFLCGCEANAFKATCRPDCPVHAEMQAKLAATGAEPPRRFRPLPPPVVLTTSPVKQLHREQFLEAMRLVREEVRKGTKLRLLVELLNQRGFKTRTGRHWTYGMLSSELRKDPAVPETAEPSA